MPTARPGALVRRGPNSLSAETVRWLVENEAAVRELHEGIEAKRQDALTAMAEAEETLRKLNTKQITMNERERQLNEREADQETVKAELRRMGKVLSDAETVLREAACFMSETSQKELLHA